MVGLESNEEEASSPVPEHEQHHPEFVLARSRLAGNLWIGRQTLRNKSELDLHKENLRHEEALRTLELQHEVDKLTQRNRPFEIISRYTSFVVAFISIVTGLVVNNSNDIEKEAKAAQSEADIAKAAMENGYEQVSEVTETHWYRADDRVTLWKKKDGTSYSGDLKAEKKDLQPKR